MPKSKRGFSNSPTYQIRQSPSDLSLGFRPHLHRLFLDGACIFHGNRPNFHRLRRLDGSELNQLLDTLSRRIVRLLEHAELSIAELQHPSPDGVPDSGLEHLQTASVAYRIAIGPHAGRKALTLHSNAGQPPAP